jgi:hypothetical protein
VNGWYKQKDLEIAGEMMYYSKSLYATVRRTNWSLLFKTGIVDADYKVMQ